MSKQLYVPSDYGILDEPTEVKWYLSDESRTGNVGAMSYAYVPTRVLPSAQWTNQPLRLCQYDFGSESTSIPTTLRFSCRVWHSYGEGDDGEFVPTYIDVTNFVRFGMLPGSASSLMTGEQFCQAIADAIRNGTPATIPVRMTFTAQLSEIPYALPTLRNIINGPDAQQIDYYSLQVHNAGIASAMSVRAQDYTWGERNMFSFINFGSQYVHTPASEYTTSREDYSAGFEITSERVMQAKNVQVQIEDLAIQCNTPMAMQPGSASAYTCSNAKVLEADSQGLSPVNIFAFADPSLPGHTNPDLPGVVVPKRIYPTVRTVTTAATGFCAAYLGKELPVGPDSPELLIVEMNFDFPINANNLRFDGFRIGYLDCPKS